jgi:hypothetical protein
MITESDKRIINLGNDDDSDVEMLDDDDLKTPTLYNMKKEITVDINNMGMKSLLDSKKQIKRIKEDIQQMINPLQGKYPCIKRVKNEQVN